MKPGEFEEGRRNLWLKKIKRKDYSPSSKNAVVCIKHFSEKFVITEDHAVRDDGSVLTVKRIYPKLTPDAYPSIFPNQPAYLSSDPVSKRKTPSERRNEILDEKKFTDWCLKDIIKTFDDFLKEFPTKLTKEWLFIVQEDDVLFYKLNIFNGQAPRIKVSFKVDRNLSVTAWHGEIALSNESLHILQGNKCDRWTKFDCLLSTLGNYEEKNVCIEDKFNYTLNFLQDVRKQKEMEEGMRKLYIFEILYTIFQGD
ncbi:THAP-type domain-containing protein [Caerostris extrusa]|uniref:THAP-type domain-containing protein n=1 Tax=Caerostris extrusa TaxID=172846 RepID=A0AAV4WK48_CAEEX|nr:THAP-type domain-containing protein [Caerostris extrusa]